MKTPSNKTSAASASTSAKAKQEQPAPDSTLPQQPSRRPAKRQKTLAVLKQAIDPAPAKEDLRRMTTRSMAKQASSTIPFKFSLTSKYRFIDLAVEEEALDVVTPMFEESNPRREKKKAKRIARKKSKREARAQYCSVMFTPAQAIAALNNPQLSWNVPYGLPTGEYLSYPVERSYHLGAMGRYTAPSTTAAAAETQLPHRPHPA